MYSVPACNIDSSKRVDCFGESSESTPDEQKVPYVTPEYCIEKGCCYDDMYMEESQTWFYKPPGRTWCFKKKGGGKLCLLSDRIGRFIVELGIFRHSQFL